MVSVEGLKLVVCDVILLVHALMMYGLSALVSGTKVKSVRTQTSHKQKVVTSPGKQHLLYALTQENQYVFSPSRDEPAVCGPLEGHLIPMAIPLGRGT